MKTVHRLFLIASCWATASSFVLAQEWTRFRGPNGTGISPSKTIPTHWTEKDVNWKLDLPGTGHSSPVLWGDRVFLTSTGDEQGGLHVLCVSAENGRLTWRRDFSLAPFKKHKFNSYAAATPAVDRDRLYIVRTEPERYTVMALDHSGKTVWERDLGPFATENGCGPSPILYQDKVIIGNEQDGPSFVTALEAVTGRTVWQTARTPAKSAYSTPCVYEPKGGRPALIFNSQAHGIYAVEPGTGKVLWEYDKAFDKRSVSSPVVAGEIIFGSCGSGGGGNFVTAIRAGDSSGSRKPELAYQLKSSAPYVPTGVAVGDLVWLWSDAGIVTCLHAPTGQTRYQERVGGNFFGSPVWVDGRLFAISTSGEVVVLEASDKFKVLERYPLNELCHTTPAIAGGRMFIRTEKRLFSIGGSRKNQDAR